MINHLLQKMDALQAEAGGALLQGKTKEELYQIKVRYLGKKGLLTDILKELGRLPATDRPQIGARANQLKSVLLSAYAGQLEKLGRAALADSLSSVKIDATLPGISAPKGSVHPLSRVLSEMKAIFRRMGFDLYEGPEIETDYYNFEALNIPKEHPARDMQDTFYLGGLSGPAGDSSCLSQAAWPRPGKAGSSASSREYLLRTHTSPVQIRVMEKSRPPIRMVAPGAVYRRDSDVSHSPMFHQIEGLVVDEGITLGHLKGVLEVFLRQIFRPGIRVKLRPSFFPFTEPSAEVDIECVLCAGKGCRVCKQTGWLEIMGCGMVDPAVFKFMKIDPEKYTGFAFGIGIERVAMLKHGINDIRLFYENDRRFLEQF